MKLYLALLPFLALSSLAADLDVYNIEVKQDGQDLVIIATGQGNAPEIKKVVEDTLKEIIKTDRYREDVYSVKENFCGAKVRAQFVDGKIELINDGYESSVTYLNFFNAPSIVNSGLAASEWVSKFKKQITKSIEK